MKDLFGRRNRLRSIGSRERRLEIITKDGMCRGDVALLHFKGAYMCNNDITVLAIVLTK